MVVDRVKVDPSAEDRLADSLGTCFTDALDVFRYPRFRGERRNVIVPLAVSERPLSTER